MPVDLNERLPIGLAREKTRQQSLSDPLNEDGQDSCRICRGEGTSTQPLYYPCKCSGSIKYVHQECLMEWLSHSQKKYCELCKTSFRFTKLYDHSMPSRLPIPLFVSQLIRHALSAFSRYIRYFLVTIVWICCLPWCIRQIWRGLFWLADGNWLDERHQHDPLYNRTNITIDSSLGNALPTASSSVPKSFENIKIVLPPMQFSLADILRLVTNQGLIGRVVHLLISLILPFSANTTARDVTNMTDAPHFSPRPSSLLSEVQFLANWSTYPAVNNTTVDVAEGLLICISLVTAFILVFLIREWVINQQQNLNMPDADAANNQNPVVLPQPAPVEEIIVQQPGMPRVRHRRIGIQDELRADAGRAARPVAVPRIRRALTDDNIAFPTGMPVERLPALNRTESTPSASTENRLNDDSDEDYLESSSLEDLSMGRNLSNSIMVQSEVEIVPGNDDTEGLGHILRQIETDNESATGNATDHDVDMEDPTFVPNQAQSVLETDFLLARGDEFAQAESIVHGTNFEPSRGEPSNEVDSEGSVIPTPDSSGDDLALQQPNRTETLVITDADTDESTLNPLSHIEPVEDSSRLQKISAWLWQVDEDVNLVATQNATEGHDDEQIIDDIQAEAPFVPNHNREPIPNLLPPVPDPAPAVPAAREPNIVFGVDLNDPNAADDAEDFDGILELLGMEGPFIAMVQNVIFVLFLISVTLSASVWCPYIWGKIALLLIMNPVGMVIKAPLFVLSRAADIVVDVIFFVTGLIGLVLNQPLKIIRTGAILVFPAVGKFLDLEALQAFTLEISQKSGTRLEKTLTGAISNLKPDLPSFSMLSHYALRTLRANVHGFFDTVGGILVQAYSAVTDQSLNLQSVPRHVGKLIINIPQVLTAIIHIFQSCIDNLHTFVVNFNTDPPTIPEFVDDHPVAWSTEDRVTTIVLGYAFFLAAGILFLKLTHLVLGLRDNEKVEGYFADSLRQTGGVMKVIVIIGIEMLVFPLYCGLLLDMALLPLFADATIASRIAFMARAPFTGIFIHWFIGTCYMFHFALFVSVCRKILRKGVLYFIRDPDDPTFHPVRDVLERPVPTQLGKIAFSALVYGGLVMVCLGGVIWMLNLTGVVFPIQWFTAEPKLSFPIDVIFYNFMLPLILRKADPSKKINSMYEWWFRRCAKTLRLTAFLFGDDRPEEKVENANDKLSWLFGLLNGTRNIAQHGTYVRAPASDSVRIPRGRDVFLEVTEDNNRIDGQADPENGIHGKTDDRFVKVYLPPNFRARIATFILLLWVFAALTGVSVTIGPLLIGRKVLRILSRSTLPPNDLYAFTVGLHLSIAIAIGVLYSRPSLRSIRTTADHWTTHGREAITQVALFARHVLGLVYLVAFMGFVVPAAIALITELYILIPIFTYLDRQNGKPPKSSRNAFGGPTATVFILQTWTIGLLYLRLFLRLFLGYFARDTQAARAIQAIARDGIFRPNIRLASRALVLPLSAICLLLLATPLALARIAIFFLQIENKTVQTQLYRSAYPGLLALCLLWYIIWTLKRQLESWRIKIRDEVYLIGERLHNFHEPKNEVRILRLGK